VLRSVSLLLGVAGVLLCTSRRLRTTLSSGAGTAGTTLATIAVLAAMTVEGLGASASEPVLDDGGAGFKELDMEETVSVVAGVSFWFFRVSSSGMRSSRASRKEEKGQEQ
jgi:hypothetical protein